MAGELDHWLKIAEAKGLSPVVGPAPKLPGPMPEKGKNRQLKLPGADETRGPDAPGRSGKGRSSAPGVKKKRWSGRSGKTDGRSTWAVILYPACRVVSEANAREHWAAARRRHKEQSNAVNVVMYDCPLNLNGIKNRMPLTVTFTHIGPEMDDDNLAGSMKYVRDEVARIAGVDDGPGNGWTWKYNQRPGPKGVEIRIEPTQES